MELTARPSGGSGLRRGWRGQGLSRAERRTIALGAVGAAGAIAFFAVEVGRVWKRGSAPLPGEADNVLQAAEQAVSETVGAAVAGYQEAPIRQNATFALFASFVTTFSLARGITFALRNRSTVGPFRDLKVGRRHIHHFVPGIALAFLSGTAAIVSSDESLEPKLALIFGLGMGLTLDESALLLNLEDVYWTEEGLLSLQVTATATALAAALALAWRFMRRGEELVLPAAAGTPA